MDALIKALEARGYEVVASDGERPITWVKIGQTRLSMRLEEQLKSEEQIESFLESRRTFTYSPSGMLTLRIDHISASNYRKQWSDGKAPLETRLNSVISGMINATEASRLENERREKWQREYQEEQRQRAERARLHQEEEARWEDFQKKLAAWEKAERIRAFVKAVQARAAKNADAGHPYLDAWITWALNRAETLDPTTSPDLKRQWPPPEGARVKLKDGYRWESYEYEGAPIVAPVTAITGTCESTEDDADIYDV